MKHIAAAIDVFAGWWLIGMAVDVHPLWIVPLIICTAAVLTE